MKGRGVSRLYLSRAQMARVGVDILNRDRVYLKCQTCGAEWSLNVKPGGLLPKNYWICENGCNDFALPCQGRLALSPVSECKEAAS